MDHSRAVAEKLLQINAIKLSVERPFTWASGWKSPIYCDNRKSLSFPGTRDLIKEALCSLVSGVYSNADIVAGVATAGIPWGAMVADQLKLPYIYVRPKPKEHGLGNQIEGFCEPGKQVVVIEDLISTGKSSLLVVDVLRAAGLQVAGMVAIFNYGFLQAREAFESAGVTNHALTGYDTLIALAVEQGIVSKEALNTLLNWHANPASWNQKV
jgi:orotate phosphoribosyltransferase